MEAAADSSWGIFIGFTVILTGGCAFLMGQAVANTWRPFWQLYPYSLLLAATDRFLIFALFNGELLAIKPYLLAAAVVFGLAAFGFRITRVDMMVRQYPWLFRRSSPFSWQTVAGGKDG